MAAVITPEIADQARKSSERKHQGPTSHGRGGAGKFYLILTFLICHILTPPTPHFTKRKHTQYSPFLRIAMIAKPKLTHILSHRQFRQLCKRRPCRPSRPRDANHQVKSLHHRPRRNRQHGTKRQPRGGAQSPRCRCVSLPKPSPFQNLKITSLTLHFFSSERLVRIQTKTSTSAAAVEETSSAQARKMSSTRRRTVTVPLRMMTAATTRTRTRRAWRRRRRSFWLERSELVH